jgi:chemosensory pili system protein ChpA (sensor histidine kinase/response regulator)
MAQPLALVVDDEPDLIFIFSEALRLAGFEVITARDGREALARLAETVPAVVTLDMNLPFVGGEALLKHIRSSARLASTRVIIITGQTQMAHNLRETADLVLVKPIRMDQLSEMAQRLRTQVTDDTD